MPAAACTVVPASRPPTHLLGRFSWMPMTCRTQRRRTFQQVPSSSLASPPPPTTAPAFTEQEMQLLESLLGVQGRGRGAGLKQLQEVDDGVQKLESLGGVPEPTSSSLIEGKWQLVFTTRPGTASPIQRTFVGVDSFKIFQEVYLRTDDPRVTNIVEFSDSFGELRVEAVATVKDAKRILFQFDRAAFSIKFLPFKVPYPLPFRLLGDEAKGWLDTTYLSQTGNMRISRGNKGTTFVLQKIADPRQKLLSAVLAKSGVEEAVVDLISSSTTETEVGLETLVGEWQLLWASKVDTESQTATVSYGLKGMQEIFKDGQIQNKIPSIPGFISLNARGILMKGPKGNTFNVSMTKGDIQIGILKFNMDVEEHEMIILYVDKKIRITKIGKYKLVHLRLD